MAGGMRARPEPAGGIDHTLPKGQLGLTLALSFYLKEPIFWSDLYPLGERTPRTGQTHTMNPIAVHNQRADRDRRHAGDRGPGLDQAKDAGILGIASTARVCPGYRPVPGPQPSLLIRVQDITPSGWYGR